MRTDVPGGGWRALGRAGVAVAVVAAALVTLRSVPVLASARELADAVGALGPAAGVVLPLVYVPWMLVGIPIAPLGVVAGFLLGTVPGGFAATAGCTLGSCVAFLFARGAARTLVERLAARAPRLAAVRRAVAARGFRLVLLLRLAPVLPIPLLSHTLGLTPVSLRDFAGGTLLGVAPSAFVYAAGGALLRRTGSQADAAALQLDGATLAAAVVASVALGAAAARVLAGELKAHRDAPAG